MARIGCICLPGAGHVNPLASLAVELTKRGHEVVFFAVPDFVPDLQARGLRVCVTGVVGFPAGTISERDSALGSLAGLEAFSRSNEYVLRYYEAILTEPLDTLRRHQLDLLLVDQADLAGSVIARALPVPFITVALCLLMNEDDGEAAPWSPVRQSDSDAGRSYQRRTWQSLSRYASRPFLECVNRFGAHLGLERFNRIADLWSNLAQISQQPPSFEFPRKSLPECFHFTGPFHSSESRPRVPFPYDRLSGRPLIYCTFGTMASRQIQPLRAVAEACENLPVQLVISLGGSAVEPPQLAGEPIVVRFAPQLEMLRRATMMVTHAGLNSALECLSHGVPMVAVPITIDQPAVAARIVACGAGVSLDYSETSPSKMRLAITTVLGDPSYRLAAKRMQQEIIAADGLRRAADLVERQLCIH